MFEILDESEGNVLGIKAIDKLTREDYRQFIPRMERIIQEHGKLRVLFDMTDFHGWKWSAIWDDLKFDFKHERDVERCAILGDKRWEERLIKLFRPLLKTKVEYFDQTRREEAWQWIKED